MDQAIPQQHPATVLRSRFRLVRALLVAAMVAVLALSVAVVILASEDSDVSGSAPAQAEALPAPDRSAPGVRYDGGPEEGNPGTVQTQDERNMDAFIRGH